MPEELYEVTKRHQEEISHLFHEIEQRIGNHELDPELVIHAFQALLTNRVWRESVDTIVAGLPSLTWVRSKSRRRIVENPDDYLFLTLPEEVLSRPIESFDFSTRTYHCLGYQGIRTLEGLLEWSEKDLLNIRNFGKRSIKEVKEKLESEGWHLARPDLEPPPGDQWVRWEGGRKYRKRLLSNVMGEDLRPNIFSWGSPVGKSLKYFGITTIGQLLSRNLNDLVRLPWAECKLTREKPNSRTHPPETEEYTLSPADAVEEILKVLKSRGLPMPGIPR